MSGLKTVFMLCAFTISCFAYSQTKQANLKQFNNFSASFEVPAGKTWVIEQLFSSFATDVKAKADGTTEITPIRIFIKTFNGDIKTDWQGNRFGPQVFQSNSSMATMPFPLTLPEGTKISFVIVQGDPGNCKAFDGSAYMSYYEISNK